METTTSAPTQQKPINSLILDTGPLIKNTISISTLINAAEELYTTPAILSEIRDDATRSRVQTTLLPFLKIRTPTPASYDAVSAFSKKTGDYPVLSKQDMGILALAYEIHCEKNGGPVGLRQEPNKVKKKKVVQNRPEVKGEKKQEIVQAEPNVEDEVAETPAEDDGWEQPTGKRATKRKAAKPMKFKYEAAEEETSEEAPDDASAEQGGVSITSEQINEQEALQSEAVSITEKIDEKEPASTSQEVPLQEQVTPEVPSEKQDASTEGVKITSEQISEQETLQKEATAQEASGESKNVEETLPSASQDIQAEQKATTEVPAEPSNAATETDASISQETSNLAISQEPTPPATDSSSDADSSDGEWITPSNLEAHQIADSNPLSSSTKTTSATQISVASMTIDFAMQNVLLQMNLLLLSPSLQRIKHVVTKVLRCHACFHIERDMSLSFCPRCGAATLNKVSCSTDSRGVFRIHLSKNYNQNKRGDKYSIPKPIAGTANGKWSGQGGGKGGWGRDLILAPDQKELVKKVAEEKRGKTRDLMDQDYLPGILTGDRGRSGGRVKVGAGKNVNSKKRT